MRIVGVVTSERLRVLRHADDIMLEEIRAAGWYDRIGQAFAVLLPLRTVGVMGTSAATRTWWPSGASRRRTS